MQFNSTTYVFVFLPTVVLLYWQMGVRQRMWLIFIASMIFYGFWRFDFVPLVLFSAILDYALAIMISKADREARRRFLMLLSVGLNLLILGIFKYLVFFTESAGSLARLIGYDLGPVTLHIILPLGISFYIFQTMSYTLDVYRRELPAERDLLKYLCFVTFFGHMVAGPILRARVLMPQFAERPPFEPARLAEGVGRIISGLVLKVVLADTIAEFADLGFARPVNELSMLDAWTLAFLFGFQIYFDFAGYSHIAIGSALLLGITLPENFNFPYISLSPREFWQRWHISLSTWIRDYLYLPLLGSFKSSRDDAWDPLSQKDTRAGGIQRAGALFLTWIIMGFWHGANWTFGLWGLYHALLIQGQRIVNLVFGPRNGPIWSLAGFAITLPLSMAGWVPFRCQTVFDAFSMWRKMIDIPSLFSLSLGLVPNSYLLAAAMLLGMLGTWIWSCLLQPKLNRNSGAVSLVGGSIYYAVAIALVVTFLQIKAQFIYFQF